MYITLTCPNCEGITFTTIESDDFQIGKELLIFDTGNPDDKVRCNNCKNEFYVKNLVTKLRGY